MPTTPRSDAGSAPQEDAYKLAATAIVSAKNGDVAAAEALLRRAVRGRNAGVLPVAFFVEALRMAGHGILADQFRAACVEDGLDGTATTPSLEDQIFAMTPEMARRQCDRYEAIFAAGHINPIMIGRYGLALQRAGRPEDFNRHIGHGPIRERLVDGIPGFSSLPEFHRVLMQELEANARRSLRSGTDFMWDVERLQDVHRLDTPAVAALMTEVRAELADFADQLRLAPTHPLEKMRPAGQKLSAWANIYRTGGHVRPHIHPGAWLVAVYYPEFPEQQAHESGALKIGFPAVSADKGETECAQTINPKPGSMVVMPGYCFHWSSPFHGEGRRVAISVNWLRP